jgi:superfamily II DNA or RNA helicase
MIAHGFNRGKTSKIFSKPRRGGRAFLQATGLVIFFAMATARHPKASVFVQQKLFAELATFVELEQRIAHLPDEKTRGDAFEVFAEAYLATQRKHDADTVWPLTSVPTDLLAALKLGTQDYGIDGVLQTRLGQHSAYQVKFRTGRPALTWRELSTFMGLADSPNIHSRILLTNCDELPAVLNDRQGFFCIRGTDLDRLETDDFQTIAAWLADSVYSAPRKTPQPHQAEALEKILPALQEHDRVSAIMACGTGKTLVALWVAEHIAKTGGMVERGSVGRVTPYAPPPVNESVLVHHDGAHGVTRPTTASNILVQLPSLALLRQTLHEWLRETSLPSLAYLCVCSDATVKEGVDALTTAQSDLDFEVTTNAASVRAFLDARFAGTKIIFCTYQSARVVGGAMQAGETFDLGIFDEAHKTAGREGRNFALALEDKNLPIRKRLFMTATPRHYNPHQRDREGESKLVFSMDRPEVYGPQIYRLTFAEAARRGIICGYKVIISVITSERVTNELLSRGEVLVNGDAVLARQVANQIALRDAVEKYGTRKIFTFHKTVKSAASFVAAGNEGVGTHLNGDGRAVLPRRPDQSELAAPQRGPTDKFQTFHVNGTMPTARREHAMRDFRAAPLAVMSNARCLTEGVDVPAVDMVAFLSPRRSLVDIVQATGRAMRRSPGKTTGYVLVPLYVEQAGGETIELAIQRAEFDEVWQVLQSLQEQDEILAGIISQLREFRGIGAGFDDSRFGDYVDVLGPRVELEVLKTAISTRCADTLGSTWDERLGQLKAFFERMGHLHVEQDRLLQEWVWIQRRLKKKGKLAADRIRRLNEIGFNWDVTKGQRIWEIMFAKLCVFKRQHGHCDVKNKPAGSFVLQSWLDDQFRLFASNRLASDRLEKLKHLGVVFDVLVKDPSQAREIMFERLLAYKAQYGDCDVPRHFYGIERLAWWVVCQRKLRSEESLEPDFIRRLDEIGFVWDRKEYLWRKMYYAVNRLLSEGGISRLESYLDLAGESNGELRQWVNALQSAKKRGTLDPKKQADLEKMRFPWQFPKRPKVSFKPKWDDVFTKLVEFHKTHGHCDMKRVVPVDENLHKWCQEQRRAKQSNTLSSEQVCNLDTLGFIWDTDELLWEWLFQEMLIYKSVHGDCNVPRYSQKYSQLAVWVASQRKQYAKAALKKDHIKRLNALDFQW